jgi:hypothetical protein
VGSSGCAGLLARLLARASRAVAAAAEQRESVRRRAVQAARTGWRRQGGARGRAAYGPGARATEQDGPGGGHLGLAGPAQALRGSGAQAQTGAAAGAGRGWRDGAARVQGAGEHWP